MCLEIEEGSEEITTFRDGDEIVDSDRKEIWECVNRNAKFRISVRVRAGTRAAFERRNGDIE